ncbi:MAG: ABC transporter ATP-binding protein, partial [Nitrospirae bacterium]|nr:ABC transporter ATP-binding protein [Nitrospirota bacterium]
METAIKTEGLSKTFKGKKGTQVNALIGLNLEIQKGEIFGFLGPNGAGKSTTIKLIMGLIRPTSGSFSVLGLTVSSDEYKKHIGYLPENPSYYDYLTAEELLHFVGSTFSMETTEIEQNSEHLLKTLDIYESRKRPIKSYSKCMLQRLGLAQALIHDPEIFVLDEPMSGLDPIGRILVRNLILELKSKGKAVFMSTHILNDIETICDRVGIIINGELKRIVKIKDILEKDIISYDITFSSTNNEPEILNTFKGQFSKRVDTFNLKILPQDLTKILSNISKDKDITLHLIQPERKG